MRKRKKVMLIGVLVAIFISGCSPNLEEDNTILTTTTMVKDIVVNLAPDDVKVRSLMNIGVDPHEFEPSARDTIRLKNAELVVYSGLNLEGKMIDIFQKLDYVGVDVIEATKDLDPRELMFWEDEDADGLYDPHIWNSIELWGQVTDTIADGLKKKFPNDEKNIEKRRVNYKDNLLELDKWLTEKVKEIPEKDRYLVTAHDAFGYLARDYGFEVLAIQGASTETEANTRDIENLAKFIVDKNIKSIFLESSVPSRNTEALQEAVTMKGGSVDIGGELFSDSLGGKDSGAENYMDMMKTNMDTIIDALK